GHVEPVAILQAQAGRAQGRALVEGEGGGAERRGIVGGHASPSVGRWQMLPYAIFESFSAESVRMTINQQIDSEALRHQLEELRQDHRDLDNAIQALVDQGSPDNLQLQRLKKRKLGLKDQMARLESMLLPDIIA
ncbi:MAG: YdcH family protein, partial [Ferrovibrionaceae bacterium]